MRTGDIIGAAVCALLSACAAGGQRDTSTGGVPREGDATAPPSMEALPALGFEERTLTREMRMARMLSAESLNLPDPKDPNDRSSPALEAWSNRELKAWLEQKHVRAEAARQELDVAAEQSHPQRIVAGAMVGLVYEDVARVLLSMPTPMELDREPEVARMYRDVLARQAMPYLVQAKAAYFACAGNADQLENMRHWSEFCTARRGRLPHVSVPPDPLASASDADMAIGPVIPVQAAPTQPVAPTPELAPPAQANPPAVAPPGDAPPAPAEP